MAVRELDPKWALGAEVIEAESGTSSAVREGKITKVTKTSVTVTFNNGGSARYIDGFSDRLKMVGQANHYRRKWLQLASDPTARRQLLESRALVLSYEVKAELGKFNGSINEAERLRKVLADFIDKKTLLNEEAKADREATA